MSPNDARGTGRQAKTIQHGLRLPWTSSFPTCLTGDTGAWGARGKLEHSLTKVQDPTRDLAFHMKTPHGIRTAKNLNSQTSFKAPLTEMYCACTCVCACAHVYACEHVCVWFYNGLAG